MTDKFRKNLIVFFSVFFTVILSFILPFLSMWFPDVINKVNLSYASTDVEKYNLDEEVVYLSGNGSSFGGNTLSRIRWVTPRRMRLYRFRPRGLPMKLTVKNFQTAEKPVTVHI